MNINPDGQPDQEELDRINAELLDRVARARAAYEEMKSAATELKAIRENLGPLNPDGTTASMNALRMQRKATQDYSDAIKALTDFSLERKLPTDPHR